MQFNREDKISKDLSNIEFTLNVIDYASIYWADTSENEELRKYYLEKRQFLIFELLEKLSAINNNANPYSFLSNAHIRKWDHLGMGDDSCAAKKILEWFCTVCDIVGPFNPGGGAALGSGLVPLLPDQFIKDRMEELINQGRNDEAIDLEKERSETAGDKKKLEDICDEIIRQRGVEEREEKYQECLKNKKMDQQSLQKNSTP
jgi:hypothetical protein